MQTRDWFFVLIGSWRTPALAVPGRAVETLRSSLAKLQQGSSSTYQKTFARLLPQKLN